MQEPQQLYTPLLIAEERLDREPPVQFQSGVNIMLIEDRAQDIARMQHLVSQDSGISSLVVISDGWRALDYLYGREDQIDVPHVILLSTEAPNVQGVEFVGDMRWEREYNAIPVVLLCPPSSRDVEPHSRAFGVLGCTKKPVSPATLSWICESVRHYWTGIDMLEDLQDAA